MFNFEDLSAEDTVQMLEMSAENKSEPRRDVKTTVDKIRRDISHASKDLASAGKTWVDSTAKFVQDVSPKVSATIDESLEKTAETFKRTMTTIDTQTKPQQVKLLRAYKSFLSKQVDAIEKRLKKLKE
jgi:gas vesicle protein